EWIVTDRRKEVELAHRIISNGKSWRGFLPPDHTLNQYSTSLFGGYWKTVYRESGRLLGTTEALIGQSRARIYLQEIKIELGHKVSADLKPGSYVLARYFDPPWDGFYEVLNIVSRDIVVGRTYMGEFPNGVRLFHFLLVQRYG